MDLRSEVDGLFDRQSTCRGRVAVDPTDVREVKAVHSAPMTAGLVPMLRALTATGHTVTIVSNNSDAAMRAFMTAHGLDAYTRGAAARTEPDPRLLKPVPHLVNTAVS